VRTSPSFLNNQLQHHPSTAPPPVRAPHPPPAQADTNSPPISHKQLRSPVFSYSPPNLNRLCGLRAAIASVSYDLFPSRSPLLSVHQRQYSYLARRRELPKRVAPLIAPAPHSLLAPTHLRRPLYPFCSAITRRTLVFSVCLLAWARRFHSPAAFPHCPSFAPY